jgi:SAM-dependent methyltransferase
VIRGAGTHDVDWPGRWQAWERQSRAYLPQREGCLATLTTTLVRLAGQRPRVLDLGAGTGMLSAAILDAVPEARCAAVDLDPVMTEIGRRTLGDADGRLRWVDADLRDPAWVAAVDGEFDAVVSLTAFHMLGAPRQASLYGELWHLLPAGGVLLNADFASCDCPRLRDAIERVEADRTQAAIAAGVARSFAGWREDLEGEPGFAGLLAERARRFGATKTDSILSASEHVASLRQAGFAEVDTLWQDGSIRLFAALS